MAASKNNRRNSSAVEDYLERILELIDSKGYARVVDIAGVGHAPWLMSQDQIGIVSDFLLSPDDGGIT